MTLTQSGRKVLRGLAFAGVAAAGYAFGITSDNLSAQPPVSPTTPPPAAAPQPLPKGPNLPEPDRRVVAFINGPNNALIPVTREELGDYLIARGGHEKLELFVNKRIIELEAARRGVTVTNVELKAKLEETIRGIGISLKDFEERFLPHYKKSLYEYIEDVLRPELLLTKMCKERVKVSDEDIQKEFENRHGERRIAQIICWNEMDNRIANKQWDQARKGDAEFNSIARHQADPNLAAVEGRVKPVGRHLDNSKDKAVVDTLFSLKAGEMSGLIEVPAGLMCVKCVEIIPPDDTVKLDEKLKAEIRAELAVKKLEQEIPKFFLELREAAKPNILLKGSPSVAEFRDGVKQIINQAGGVPQLPAPKQ